MVPAAGTQRLGMHRSIVLLALAAVIPLLLLGAVLTQLYAGREQADFDRQLELASSRTAAAVSRELQAQIDLLSIVAESPRLDAPLQSELFSELAERLRTQVPVWANLRVSDRSGTVLLTSPHIEDAIGARVVEPASHDRVVQTGLPSIGQMVKGPQGNSGFVVRVPVVRDGETVYVLSALLRPSLLTTSLQSTALPEDWQSWIVDEQDQIVASTSPQTPKFAELPKLAYGPANIEEQWSDAVRVTGKTLSTSTWRAMVAMPQADFTRPRETSLALLLLAMLTATGLSVLALVLSRNEISARRSQDAAVADWQRLDALSKLAGGLAHDFNNLLMGIQGGVEQLRRRRNDEQRFDQVTEMMLEAVERGKTTTQRLLGFSRRSDAGAEIIQLQDHADELLQLLKQAVPESIAVSLEVAADTFPLRIDLGALQVALINIASNAKDAMPDGGRLQVSIRNVAQASDITLQLRGPHVVITASDTGIGISPEHINRIFDPFYTTKGPSSSGLGLSQVYGLAARSGGTALASSVPGSGSMISVLLPKSDKLAPYRASTTPQQLPPHLSVLVVDDEASVAQAVAGMIEAIGYTVTVASNASAGLEQLAQRQQDILITDVTMPGMSGLDFATEARRRFPQMGIILMSGYSTQLESGAQHSFPLLAKPFKGEDLLAKLGEETRRKAAMTNVVSIEEGKRS
jgi:signal transduction histidine kinase/CheY-like chemotaxis protein